MELVFARFAAALIKRDAIWDGALYFLCPLALPAAVLIRALAVYCWE